MNKQLQINQLMSFLLSEASGALNKGGIPSYLMGLLVDANRIHHAITASKP